MSAEPKRERVWRRVVDACRIVVGVVFIFSGLTKIIDPYGTALKTAEYLQAMGLGFAAPASSLLAILQITLETSLGIILLTRLFRRAASLCAFAVMAFFTLLTLWLAVANPIEDCGCFGDMIVLTNWQTFFKNLILLPLSAVAWLGYRRGKLLQQSLGAWIAVGVTVAFTACVALRNLLLLPVVDTSALKAGTSLREAAESRAERVEAEVVYRNRTTGRQQRFKLDDPTWWDDAEWEFVETIVSGGGGGRVKVTPDDFAIFDATGNATADVVDAGGTVQMLVVQDLEQLNERRRAAFERFAERAAAAGDRVVCVTASENPDQFGDLLGFGREIPCYTMDITVMQVLLRADCGVVTLKGGQIADKHSMFSLRLR